MRSKGIKLFTVVIYECLWRARVFVHDKFTQPSLKCLLVRPGAYPRMEHLRGASLGKAPALLTSSRLGWKGLPRTNSLNVIRKFVNYGRKKFHNIGLR